MATLASGKLSEMFEDFLKSVTDRSGAFVYRDKISQLISSEGKSLVVDFGDLLKYNNDLANRVLLEPDSSLASFKIAAFETMRSENALYADRVKRELVVRLRGITDLVPLRQVDTSYIDKMIAVSGMVVRTSELRPLMTEAAWVCPSGHLTYQVQDDLALKKPAKCELCGEARNFELDKRHSRFIDFQVVRVQELPEELPPGQLPQFFDVNIEGDIVNTARPGDRVVLTGVVRAVPDYALGQVRTRLFRSQIDCNQVEVKGKEPETVLVTKEDEELIRKVAGAPDAYDRLVSSIAPVILGHQSEKEAILLLLAGGNATVLPDGTKLRGDINALFVGDPGTGKSEMLKFASQVAPRGLYASGRGTSLDFQEPVIVRKSNTVQVMKIGELVDSNYLSEASGVFVPVSDIDCLSYNPNTGKIEWTPVTFVYRHRNVSPLIRLRLQTGREVTVTDDHSLFAIRKGRLNAIRTKDVRLGDCLAVPGRIPPTPSDEPLKALYPKELLTSHHLAKLLGYYVAEGYLHEGKKKGKESYRIEFELDRDEAQIIAAIKDASVALFNKRIAVRNKKDSHGVTVSISNKNAFLLFRDVLGVSRGARFKRVPTIVFNMPKELQVEFFRSYVEGDRGVTSSPYLYSDLLYLIGTSMQKLGKFSKSKPNTGKIAGRVFKGGPSYRLKAPNPYNLERDIKPLGPPLEEVLQPFEEVLASQKRGLSLITGQQYKRLTPQVLNRLLRGKRLRRFSMLRALRSLGEMTTPALAREVGVPRHAMKQILLYSARDGLVSLSLQKRVYHASLTEKGSEALAGIEEVLTVSGSDLQFATVKKVTRVKSTSPYVYDLSVKGTENFVAGFGGVLCHNTAAGLSAAVIREKNVLMLEAGVVVLADQGIAAIDEFEKMKPEDRTALHEMMEQHSYHPLTEIAFFDGEKKKIGEVVEDAFNSNRRSVVRARECEILPTDNTLSLHSMGPDYEISKTVVDRVSRHRAPGHFLKISYSNGRSIVVTPEHPVFVYRHDGITTISASGVRKSDFVPAPIVVPPSDQEIVLNEVSSAARAKRILQQHQLTPALGRVLGYLITEGNFYLGRTTEINFANYNQWILNDMNAHAEPLFGFKPIPRMLNGKPVVLRFISKVLYDYFVRNFPEMVKLAKEKRVPKAIFAADSETIRQFLVAAFLGDGGVETDAICYRTSSRGLAEDYQDLLLRLGISSRIATDRSNWSYKVYVMGDSMPKFCKLIVDEHDPRRDKIIRLMQRGLANVRHHDAFPTDAIRILIRLRSALGLQYNGRYWRNLQEGSGISRDSFDRELHLLEKRAMTLDEFVRDDSLSVREMRRRCSWSQSELASMAGIPRGNVDYVERGGYGEERRKRIDESLRSAAADHVRSIRIALAKLDKLRQLRFLRVRKIERLENKGEWKTDWVYDLTVEPTHNFISSGLLLHNTVTIAKGGIYATLNARTAILAACNPVLGRYNPFQNLTENIGTLPIPLLSRFDLIFVFRDQPTPAEDERLASHILAVHARKTYAAPPPIEFALLKKYLAYAKRISPNLTKEAMERLKEFYLQLRREGGTDESIPPTPRTLEALIRIATARARILLREEVTEDDALSAIALMNRMVEEVLTDATTKKTDFGIQLGKPVGETKNLRSAMEIFKSLEGSEKKPVERKVFKEELVKARFSDEDAEKMIRTMFREGMVYESKPGFIRRLGG